MPGNVLIVAGGARPDPLVIKALPAVDFCVAADSGADHALSFGLDVHALVGDLDSVSAAGLEAVRSAGAEVRAFQTDKDNTDLELALLRALEESPELIVVIGIGGGRLDHEMANMAALASEDYRDVSIEGLVGSSRLTVIRGERTLTGALGETISLLPVNGRAEGITTEGLQYPLIDEPLEAGSARGVSNRFVAASATVSVRAGVLMAIQPFALKERHAR